MKNAYSRSLTALLILGLMAISETKVLFCPSPKEKPFYKNPSQDILLQTLSSRGVFYLRAKDKARPGIDVVNLAAGIVEFGTHADPPFYAKGETPPENPNLDMRVRPHKIALRGRYEFLPNQGRVSTHRLRVVSGNVVLAIADFQHLGESTLWLEWIGTAPSISRHFGIGIKLMEWLFTYGAEKQMTTLSLKTNSKYGSIVDFYNTVRDRLGIHMTMYTRVDAGGSEDRESLDIEHYSISFDLRGWAGRRRAA